MTKKYNQEAEQMVNKILNKRTLSELDKFKLEEYQFLFPQFADSIEEALFLFDTKNG